MADCTFIIELSAGQSEKGSTLDTTDCFIVAVQVLFWSLEAASLFRSGKKWFRSGESQGNFIFPEYVRIVIDLILLLTILGVIK